MTRCLYLTSHPSTYGCLLGLKAVSFPGHWSVGLLGGEEWPAPAPERRPRNGFMAGYRARTASSAWLTSGEIRIPWITAATTSFRSAAAPDSSNASRSSDRASSADV
jgi:hypothetical protein